MELVLIVVICLAVVFKLGLLSPIKDLAEVATRESTVYKDEHKARVAKRYESLAADVDIEKVNENIKKVRSLNFD